MKILLAGLCLFAIPSCRVGESDPRTTLHAAYPEVRWDTIPVRADFDCDGSDDHAVIGRYKDHVFVGFVFARSRNTDVLEYAVSAGIQQAICQEPATLEVESQDFDPPAESGALPGFRRSLSCKGLRLAGGECDSVHIYWNHNDKQITWWRL